MDVARGALAVSGFEPASGFGILITDMCPAFQTAVFRMLPPGPSIHVCALERLSALG